MKQKQLRIIGYFVLFILILNLVLFGTRMINDIVFWLIIVAGAIFSYKISRFIVKQINA